MARSKARRKTTAVQRNVRQGGDLQRLHIKVSSPRIVMYQVMRGMGKSLKVLLGLMLLARHCIRQLPRCAELILG